MTQTKVSDLQIRPSPASVLAAISSDQRAKVRMALEESFDDATGRYLDGASDAVIAERLKVPRVVVEQLREVAYGPIREDPEVTAIKAQLAALSGQIDALTRERNVLRDRVDAFAKKRAA